MHTQAERVVGTRVGTIIVEWTTLSRQSRMDRKFFIRVDCTAMLISFCHCSSYTVPFPQYYFTNLVLRIISIHY